MGLLNLFNTKNENKQEQEHTTRTSEETLLSVADKRQRCEEFWALYLGDFSHLRDLEPRELVEQSNTLLKNYIPEVFTEYEQNDEGQYYRLVLTANGMVDRFGDVMLLAQTAPELPGLEIQAFRQRASAGDFELTMGNVSLSCSDVLVKPQAEQGRISLTIAWNKPVPGDKREHALHATLLMMDHILGEYDSAVKVRYIDFLDEPINEEERSAYVTLDALAPLFDDIWHNQLGHTRLFPDQDGTWVQFQASSDEDDDDVLIGTLNEEATSIACRADMGVRLDVHAAAASRDILDRVYAFEDALNALLQPQRLGLHVLSLFPFREQVRIMTWYASDAVTALQAAEQTARQFSDLSLEFSTTYDPRWDSYLAWTQ